MDSNRDQEVLTRKKRPIGKRRTAPLASSPLRKVAPGGRIPLQLSPSAPLTPELRLTIQMVLVARRWRSLLDERLRPLGQSSARMEALSTIAYAPPYSQQIELARRLGVEGATFTRMLDSLESDGLVERLADPADRRANRIKLTKAGETVLAETMAVAERVRGHFLEGFPPASIDKANIFLDQLLCRFDQEFLPTDDE